MAGRILVTGNQGQLGRALISIFSSSYDVTGVDIQDCDIRDYDAVLDCVKDAQPDIVIHTAAFTDVDGCETNGAAAMAVNATGTENVARACKEVGARMIYYSTDYVFDGSKDVPYLETDLPNPLTVYGQSKLEGERRIIDLLDNSVILRIAWLYGAHGNNFVKTMVRLGLEQLDAQRLGHLARPLTVVDDQIGNPTWTVEVSRQTKVVIENNLTGLFHGTAEGESSWYQFACDIFDFLSLNVEMKPCRTEEYSRPAPRPKRSSLENKRLKEVKLNVMRDYKIALKDFIQKHGEELLTCNVK